MHVVASGLQSAIDKGLEGRKRTEEPGSCHVWRFRSVTTKAAGKKMGR